MGFLVLREFFLARCVTTLSTASSEGFKKTHHNGSQRIIIVAGSFINDDESMPSSWWRLLRAHVETMQKFGEGVHRIKTNWLKNSILIEEIWTKSIRPHQLWLSTLRNTVAASNCLQIMIMSDSYPSNRRGHDVFPQGSKTQQLRNY